MGTWSPPRNYTTNSIVDKQEFTIAIAGDGGVGTQLSQKKNSSSGKSTFTIMYIHNFFVEEFDPSIEDTYRKRLTLDNKKIELFILDTAVEEGNFLRNFLIGRVHGSKRRLDTQKSGVYNNV